MARGRPLATLTLSEPDRETLTRWTRRPTTAQALAQRARIVLAAADGRANDAIAAELSITPHTVGKWRRRYVERGPDGLLDEPRPGAPRTIGDDRVEAVIVKTLEAKPTDATHWSTRSMARATGMSQSLDQPDLAGLRAPAPPGRELQALDRPAVHREGPRHGRAVPRPARAGGRAVRRREEPDPGARRASSRSCRCSPPPPSGAATTMSVTARPACSPGSIR